jgi:hypothetical protein
MRSNQSVCLQVNTSINTQSNTNHQTPPIFQFQVGRKRKASASNGLASPSKKGGKSYSRTPQDPEVVMALVKRALDDCPASTRNEIAAEFDVESRLLHIVSGVVGRLNYSFLMYNVATTLLQSWANVMKWVYRHAVRRWNVLDPDH